MNRNLDDCELLPEPGRHICDDEYVDIESCGRLRKHEDHYWSTEGHIHEDGYHICDRYCPGDPV